MSLRSVEEQLEVVLAEAAPLPTMRVPLEAAAGATLAEAVRARVAIPVFDNSAMDGFAVRFEDVRAASPETPITLRVVADLPAGSPDDPPLAAGEAARIMTGAAVPTAADAIVPFEDTAGGLEDSLRSAVVTRAPRARGAHIRRRGEDLLPDDIVLEPGVALGGLALSAAAAAGVTEVVVHRRPRVIVVSTGAELAAPGAELRRGQIPESNSVLLASLAREAGAEVISVATVDDEPHSLRAVLDGAADADVVLTSGGVSAGAYEVVKNVLGGQIAFTKVAMQPGKPQAFGRLSSGALVFGLPGNPVSAAVSFEVFVRPALLRMQGRTEIARPRLRLPAARAWPTPPGRRQYLPAAVDRSDPSRWTVRPATAGGSGSHLAGGLGRAEALAVVPADVESVAVGDPVDVLLLT
ncbi:molybdopterin molybdenumtransferase MoeA [Microbacterium sediminis]|uniref:Molybdopterin molybdenumtransferase n=1 Tax=Microbacterium sediminis TaxID=904291 RepID=A0A1B9NFM2_9MICO|nr:gephyrin-like molybdotransferase Glp [Microbacterium sediminis]OCG75396.1 molybdopterin molybdenumtransferase MoeA [Microbacterium sediminis]